jgi:hypothetical protein
MSESDLEQASHGRNRPLSLARVRRLCARPAGDDVPPDGRPARQACVARATLTATASSLRLWTDTAGLGGRTGDLGLQTPASSRFGPGILRPGGGTP